MIIGYSYEAALHCIECTQQRARSAQGFGRAIESDNSRDENGIRFDALDGEWNPVRPVFITDEGSHLECCDDCFRNLEDVAYGN